jgi:hypothetical protein
LTKSDFTFHDLNPIQLSEEILAQGDFKEKLDVVNFIKSFRNSKIQKPIREHDRKT